MTAAVRYDEWWDGDALAIGRAIMEPLRVAERAGRATAVLQACRDRWLPVPEIDLVVAVGRSRWRWYEAKDAFSGVRQLILREERSRTNDTYYALLFVAELAAKTIFNASNTMAPFDADTPRHLARAARRFVAALGDDSLGPRVWAALIGGDPGRPLT